MESASFVRMKLLLVYPAFPVTYWGCQYGLPFTGWRASLPPLGLVTLAALFPSDCELRLVDLNIAPLTDRDILWADAVLVGGMRIQMPSMREVLARARALGRRTVVGGPAPTTSAAEFTDADLVFQGEAEGRIDSLLAALRAARGPSRLLAPGPDARPTLTDSPVPRFDLLDLSAYSSMAVQFSRGCPFQCEFCDVIEIFGRVPRVKPVARMLAELESLRRLGWRGSIFVVDDNFIGHRSAVRSLLVELGDWQEQHGHPFEFYTEASVNLAQEPELIRGMVRAGFTAVFLGIETQAVEALRDCGKVQNLKLELGEAVWTLSRAGLEVMGGFILGFDREPADAWLLQRRFIESVPLPFAMVGMLTALPGTALWRRLAREGRLRTSTSGDQLDRPNFVTTADPVQLLTGYRQLLVDLYTPEAYYRRCEEFVKVAPPMPGRKRHSPRHWRTFARLVARIGIASPHRAAFWRLALRSALQAPHTFTWAMGHAVVGEHMIRYTREMLVPRIDAALRELRRERMAPPAARRKRAGDGSELKGASTPV